MKPVTIQPVWDNAPVAKLYYGVDVIEGLKLLPDASVHTVATSPPFWGLRDYGTDGQIGLEQTPEKYVEKLVEVFCEAKRVLRSDGTLWLNLGDSYWGGGSTTAASQSARTHATLRPKDLVGIPWRVALALQADGWYLRSDIIWVKSSCMPESIRDRPTRAHEYVFLFAHPDSKGRYFYDPDAIREPWADARQGRVGGTNRTTPERRSIGGKERPLEAPQTAGRNKRSWWNINPKPYKGAHFAVWPPKLVEPMIRAGTSEKGCCPVCGAQWERTIEKGEVLSTGGSDTGARASNMDQVSPLGQDPKRGAYNTGKMVHRASVTVGWVPACGCPEQESVRSVVLDPFSGSATTGLVALREGRDYIGIDLNVNYLPLAQARLLNNTAPGPVVEDKDDLICEFG